MHRMLVRTPLARQTPNGLRLSCGAVGATCIETTAKSAGAQTQFLPQPGAGSFKRLLGSLFTDDARARRRPIREGS